MAGVAFAGDAIKYTLQGAKTARLSGDVFVFEPKSVVIESGRISKVVDPDTLQGERHGKVIDVTGLYLVPGLIDLHTHVTMRYVASDNFEDFLQNYDHQLEESVERRSMNATVAA